MRGGQRNGVASKRTTYGSVVPKFVASSTIFTFHFTLLHHLHAPRKTQGKTGIVWPQLTSVAPDLVLDLTSDHPLVEALATDVPVDYHQSSIGLVERNRLMHVLDSTIYLPPQLQFAYKETLACIRGPAFFCGRLALQD